MTSLLCFFSLLVSPIEGSERNLDLGLHAGAKGFLAHARVREILDSRGPVIEVGAGRYVVGSQPKTASKRAIQSATSSLVLKFRSGKSEFEKVPTESIVIDYAHHGVPFYESTWWEARLRTVLDLELDPQYLSAQATLVFDLERESILGVKLPNALNRALRTRVYATAEGYSWFVDLDKRSRISTYRLGGGFRVYPAVYTRETPNGKGEDTILAVDFRAQRQVDRPRIGPRESVWLLRLAFTYSIGDPLGLPFND